MGMPAPIHSDWTVEMAHALPDDSNRYEVIDGELFVTPAPAYIHQEAVAALFILLREYAESVGLWLAFAFCLFHGAHRFKYTLYDGLQIKHLNELIYTGCYGGAAIGAALAGWVLFRLP